MEVVEDFTFSGIPFHSLAVFYKFFIICLFSYSLFHYAKMENNTTSIRFPHNQGFLLPK